MPAIGSALDTLYAALDEQRQSRGLTWAETAREISNLYRDSAAKPISASTLTGLRSRRVVEGDGVLQMLRWLGRTPESLWSKEPGADLPTIDANQILRFDATAIHAALDARRVEKGITWPAVATEIGGVTASGLTRLARGGRVAFPDVMRIFEWLGQPAARFTRGMRA